MKFFKSTFSVVVLGLFVLVSVTQLQAQDKREAIQAFNKGLELANQEQFEQAINMFNQAITTAQQLGEEGNDIVDRAQDQLPKVHYKLAVQKYKDFQKSKSMTSLDEALKAFQEATDIGKEYGSESIASKAGSITTQLYYQKSILAFRSQNYDAAQAALDQAIERNPNYAKAYYQKGIVVKNRNRQNYEEAIQFFDKAIEVGQKTNDNQIVRQSKEAARDELIYRGVKLMENKNFSKSEELLNRALEYDAESSDAHYRLAELYNKRTSWDAALQHAQKALQFEKGGRTDKAKIYFELGTAYKAKGMKAKACDAYKNAAFGSFKAPSEHQMEYELKCEGATR
ncbi:MAG: tetratricopeptide repeat protein [Balneolaceae bacterium]|nr:tetratricopeptide repeat protein [Balneolaceae bacterium]